MGVKITEKITGALRTVYPSGSTQDIVSLNMVSSLQADKDGNVILLLLVDSSVGEKLEPLRQDAERAALSVEGVKKVTAVLTAEKTVEDFHPDHLSSSTPPDRDGKSLLSRMKITGRRSGHFHADPKENGNKKKTVPNKVDFDPHKMAKNPPLEIPAKNVIVIASGKGGVGKSTVAANISASLSIIAQNVQQKNPHEIGQFSSVSVGLLDADIYGPSQPTMMGDVLYKPALNEQRKLIPLLRHNIKIMSIGFMTDPKKALIWRGPMAQSAFYQLLRDVAWENTNPRTNTPEKLDYLIIDMPPGTGDIQLTLAQKVKISGAIIVSTPQDIALIDARRAVEMFQKTNVPILGIIENMSTHICSNCGHEEPIFGHGGAEKEAKSLNIPFLGRIPLSISIRVDSDAGTPIVLSHPDTPEAQAFMQIAEKIIAVQG